MTEEELGEALEGVLQGAVIVLTGTVIGRGAGLVTEVWVVRLFSQSQYGIFRLGILVTMLVGAVATLGFTTGLPRQLGVSRGERATGRVRETAGAAFLIGGAVALALAVVLFIFAGRIAAVFGTPSLATVLRPFALALPLVVLVDLFVAVARGLGDSRPKLYIRTLVPKFAFLGGVALVSWFGLSFDAVILAWLGSFALAVLAAVAYGYTRLDSVPTAPSVDAGRDLVSFSLPLLAVYVINSVGSWVDTFVVGFHESAALVGLYGATVLLTRLLPTVLGSVSFMYVPVASRFHARNERETVQTIYTTMTKWITGLTLPFFLTFVLFPGDLLAAVFGPEFRPGATVMRLLALGFMSHTLVGTNGQSLVMLGRRRFLALSQAASVTANLALSLVLVPIVGIEGAALGSMAAYVLTNAATSGYLYHVSGLHPFSWNYLLPVAATVVVAGGVGLVFVSGGPLPLLSLVGYAVLVGLIHLSIYLVTRSVNEGEIEIVRAIIDRTDLPLDSVIRLFEWAASGR